MPQLRSPTPRAVATAKSSPLTTRRRGLRAVSRAQHSQKCKSSKNRDYSRLGDSQEQARPEGAHRRPQESGLESLRGELRALPWSACVRLGSRDPPVAEAGVLRAGGVRPGSCERAATSFRWGGPPGPVPALSESSEHGPRAGQPTASLCPPPQWGARPRSQHRWDTCPVALVVRGSTCLCGCPQGQGLLGTDLPALSRSRRSS